MKAIVAKELRQVGPAVLLAAFLLLVLGHEVFRVRELWLLPDSEAQVAVALVSIAAGIVLAAWQTTGEELSRTRPYLLHRGVPAARIFDAKVAVGLAATAFVGFAPVLLRFVIDRASGEAEWARSERLLELGIVSTAGLAAYGVCAWQMLSNAGRPGEVLVRGSLAVGLSLVQVRFAIELTTPLALSGAAGAWLALPAIEIGLALAGLGLARRSFARGADADLPLARADALTGGALLFAFGLVPLCVLAGRVNGQVLRELQNAYPWVAIDAEGQIGLGYPRSATSWMRYGEETFDTETAEGLLAPAQLARADPGSFRTPHFALETWEHVLSPRTWWMARGEASNFVVQAYLVQPSGELVLHYDSCGELVFQEEERTGELARTALQGSSDALFEVGRGSPGARFSNQSVALAILPSAETLIADFADRTLWKLDPLELAQPVRPASLPGGDEWIGLETPRGEPFDPIFVADRSLSNRISYALVSEALFVGRSGAYRLGRDGFELVSRPALDEGASEGASEGAGDPLAIGERAPESSGRREVVVESRGDLNPVVRVVEAESGRELFRHRFAPSGLRSSVRAAALFGFALTRLPAAMVVSALSDAGAVRPWRSGPRSGARSGPMGDLVEPLVAGGRRPWLLAANLVLALALAGAATRRLRRRERDALRTAGWAALVLAGGLPAYLVFALSERASAYRRAPRRGELRRVLVARAS